MGLKMRLKEKPKSLIYSLLALLFLSILSLSTFASYRYFSNQRAEIASAHPDEQKPDANWSINPENAEELDGLAVLLSGYGGAGHQGGFLSDIIQVMYINFPDQKVSFISIPRDLYLGEGYKINATLSQGMRNNGKVNGGLELMSKKISQITGLPIKYYIGVDFVGLKVIVGRELGGIEVDVSKTLDDPWYPIAGAELDPCGYTPEEIAELTQSLSGFALESKFECRYEHIHYPAGKVKMEGHDALAYVRSRHSSSDYDRSRRQVELLVAIRNKLFDLNTLGNLPKFYGAFSQYVSTNLDLESAEKLAPLLINGREFEVQNINLSPENVLQSSKSKNGAFILLPKAGTDNWQEIQSFIAGQI